MDKNQLQSRKINTGTDLTALYGVHIVGIRQIDKSTVVPRLKTSWRFDLTAQRGWGLPPEILFALGGAQWPVISGTFPLCPTVCAKNRDKQFWK